MLPWMKDGIHQQIVYTLDALSLGQCYFTEIPLFFLYLVVWIHMCIYIYYIYYKYDYQLGIIIPGKERYTKRNEQLH